MVSFTTNPEVRPLLGVCIFCISSMRITIGLQWRITELLLAYVDILTEFGLGERRRYVR